MKENLAQPGMPPVTHEVLDRRTVMHHDGYALTVRYLAGHHPHLGETIQGWTGPETVYVREELQGEEGVIYRTKR